MANYYVDLSGDYYTDGRGSGSESDPFNGIAAIIELLNGYNGLTQIAKNDVVYMKGTADLRLVSKITVADATGWGVGDSISDDASPTGTGYYYGKVFAIDGSDIYLVQVDPNTVEYAACPTATDTIYNTTDGTSTTVSTHEFPGLVIDAPTDGGVDDYTHFIGTNAAFVDDGTKAVLHGQSTAPCGIHLDTNFDYGHFKNIRITYCSGDNGNLKFPVTVPSSWSGYHVFDNIEVDNMQAGNYPFYANYAYYSLFTRLYIHDNTGTGFVGNSAILLYDSVICNNSSSGVVTGTRGQTINCLIYGNGGDGIDIGDASSIIGCTIEGNGDDGINDVQESCIVLGNRITNNVGYGIRGGGSARIDNNYFYNNGDGNYSGVTGGDNDVVMSSDGYTDDAMDDYTLTDAAEGRRYAYTYPDGTIEYRTAGVGPDDYQADGIQSLSRKDESESIYIEQSPFHGSQGTRTRGENVWIPLGGNDYRLVRLFDNASYSTHNVAYRQIDGEWVYKCFTGSYHDPIIDSSDDYTFPDGDWSTYNHSSTGIKALYHPSRRLQLAIPAGTKRLYLLGLQNTSTCTYDLALSGDGALVKSTISQGTSNATTDIPGDGTELSQAILIATNCGGSTLTLTPDGSNNAYIIGFIAVTDTPSNPKDGVADPATAVHIQPDHQHSPGPMSLQFGASGDAFWWGAGHWTADYTLTSYVQTMQYLNDDSEPSLTTWNPTEHARVEVETDRFVLTLSGSVTVFYDSSNQDEVVGYWSHTYTFTSTGVHYSQTFTFNALAESYDLRLDDNTSNKGGYYGQWGLNPIFTHGKRAWDSEWTEFGTYDGSWVAEGEGHQWQLESPRFLATFMGKPSSRPAGGEKLSESEGGINKRSDNDGFPKVYDRWTGTAEYDIKTGDIFIGEHWRILAKKEESQKALANKRGGKQ